jgi:quinol monooxygenase YgiN
MTPVGLLVRVQARPERADDVADFLRNSVAFVESEPGTTVWFAVRLGESTFGLFDAFPDDSAREAHLSGRLAAELMEHASELFTEPPTIEPIDVLATKLPS